MAKEKTVIIDDTSEEMTENILKSINICFEAANIKTFKILEDFVAGGYEEFLAKILVYLPEKRQKNAIQKLPEEIQKKVSVFLASYSNKKNSDADVLSTVGFVLKNADFYGAKVTSEILGEKNAIFMNMMREKSKDLFSVNPLLSMNLEYYSVSMEILTNLDDRSLQKWLREVSSDELAKALKGASQEVQNKVFRNMSRRAGTMLQEDMEFMGPIRKSDVLESQKKLIEILKKLEERGDIVIPSSHAVFSDEMYL